MTASYQRVLTKEFSSLFKPTFHPCTVFRQPRPLPDASPLSTALYTKEREGNERQLNCLRFLRSSRQVDCARKNRQLSDLYLVIKSLLICPYHTLKTKMTSDLRIGDSPQPGQSLNPVKNRPSVIALLFLCLWSACFFFSACNPCSVCLQP